ncbi:hypothetical protein L873DRAFT_515845 [Choiromyces venosus 120613-1]|uniref:Uncharacterized protein n=1 Tax=Choiromyces venosus 120613-1 TaxID=1336337 RepID=A0A3N4IVW2_9PEZI|nr:hypothetical protein L873DRAFT_515845 [Choiromyces venosus 120613-1]
MTAPSGGRQAPEKGPSSEFPLSPRTAASKMMKKEKGSRQPEAVKYRQHSGTKHGEPEAESLGKQK